MHAPRSLLSAAALVGLAVASPAPQQLDLAEILTAPAATISGPPLAAINQTVTISTSAQIASITAQVTTVATAVITGQAAANAANLSPSSTAVNQKRDITFEKRDLLAQLLSLMGVRVATSTSSVATTTSVAAAVKVATTAATTATTSSKSASSSTSSFFTSMALTSTTSTSVVSGSMTSTSSAATACPTTPEAGTYCGFINPEDPCAPQPDGYGPANLTSDQFMAYAPFQSQAASAAAPSGYVNTFKAMNASTSANSYLGLYTLTAYDPSQCSAHCDNTTGCTSFNIYIERDPSQNPTKNDSTAATVWGYWCPNPSAITNYKCTLWGSNIDNTTAVNAGGWREDFQVLITGSNGYDKTNNTVPATVTGYSAPQNCSSKAINGGSYWLGSRFFSGPFDHTLCAAFANATTYANRQAAINASQHSYTPCQMFNAYHVYKNGVPQGTYCSLYNTQLSTSWATYSGFNTGHDCYSVRNSWSFSLTTPDSGKC